MRDMNVLYYDTECGLHPQRIIQIYKSNKCSFDNDLLRETFIRLENISIEELTDTIADIAEQKELDMLVIDSLSSVFMKEQRAIEVERLFNMLSNISSRNNIITIMVCHSKINEEKPLLYNSYAERKLEYIGELWLYFTKTIDRKCRLNNYMIITRRNRHECKEKIKFKITNKGIE